MTRSKRLAITKDEFSVGPTCHITNGDEENVPGFAGQFHKSLPHDKYGQVQAHEHDVFFFLLVFVFYSPFVRCSRLFGIGFPTSRVSYCATSHYVGVARGVCLAGSLT